MVMQTEIDKVISWCEERKKEKQRIYIVERNSFRDEIDWMRRFPLIEIDRPKETAGKFNLVYDSLTKSLWQYLGGDWRKIEQDIDRRII